MSGAQGEQTGSCVHRLRVFGGRTRVCSELKRGGGGGGGALGAPGRPAEADGGLERLPRSDFTQGGLLCRQTMPVLCLSPPPRGLGHRDPLCLCLFLCSLISIT